MKKIKQKIWEEEEVEKLCELNSNLFPHSQIAFILNRTTESIKQKLKSLRNDSTKKIVDYSRPWTEKEEQILFEMRRSVIPYKIIAAELKRTEESCKKKYTRTNWLGTEYYNDNYSGIDRLDNNKKRVFQQKLANAQERKLFVFKLGSDVIADKLVASIKALPEVPVPAYSPIISNKNKNKNRDEDMFLILSDFHIGSNFSLEETGGLAEFNQDVLLKRLKNLQYAVRDIFELHSHMYNIPKFHIGCLGDIVAGMNDTGNWSAVNIDMPIVDQFTIGWKAIEEMIHYWLTIFPEIYFYGIRGNHGRAAQKGKEKDYVNWDYMCYTYLESVFRDNPRVHFVIPKTWWIMTEIRNHNFLLVHGEDVKSRTYPFKGLVDYEMKMSGSLHTKPDYTIAGHFHNSAEMTTNHGRIIINGSVIGGDMYSMKDLQALSSPEQTIFGVHDIHGITWKYNIDLDYSREER